MTIDLGTHVKSTTIVAMVTVNIPGKYLLLFIT